MIDIFIDPSAGSDSEMAVLGFIRSVHEIAVDYSNLIVAVVPYAQLDNVGLWWG